jgi:sortase (surface protein transpeptidase)
VGVPVRLRIPRLDVNATVEPVALVHGALGTPANVWNVAWYRRGPPPGEVGNAVIDGHLDSATGPAVFLALGNLRAGDLVYVTDSSGRERAFAVTAMATYGLHDAPLSRIFGPSSERRLNLITCGGAWDEQRHTYDARLVVYTRLAG